MAEQVRMAEQETYMKIFYQATVELFKLDVEVEQEMEVEQETEVEVEMEEASDADGQASSQSVVTKTIVVTSED